MVRMRVQGQLLLVVGLLVVTAATPLAYSADYTPTRLFFTVYGDGVVSVDKIFIRSNPFFRHG